MKHYILKIKDIEIPYCIKNYKSSKSIKIYFKEDMMTITKPLYVPIREAEKFIKKNEDRIYKEYKKIFEEKLLKKSNWDDGQNVLYKGDMYEINIVYYNENALNIKIDYDNKLFVVSMPYACKNDRCEYVKKVILELFKRNTINILNKKVPYWSKITGIDYNTFNVRDARTKYGSCIPKTQNMHFTSRLVMLKDEAIDAVVVHELCHIVFANHSKDFYELVEKYIPNYKELDKYLKECSKYIRLK